MARFKKFEIECRTPPHRHTVSVRAILLVTDVGIIRLPTWKRKNIIALTFQNIILSKRRVLIEHSPSFRLHSVWCDASDGIQRLDASLWMKESTRWVLSFSIAQ